MFEYTPFEQSFVQYGFSIKKEKKKKSSINHLNSCSLSMKIFSFKKFNHQTQHVSYYTEKSILSVCEVEASYYPITLFKIILMS